MHRERVGNALNQMHLFQDKVAAVKSSRTSWGEEEGSHRCFKVSLADVTGVQNNIS